PAGEGDTRGRERPAGEPDEPRVEGQRRRAEIERHEVASREFDPHLIRVDQRDGITLADHRFDHGDRGGVDTPSKAPRGSFLGLQPPPDPGPQLGADHHVLAQGRTGRRCSPREGMPGTTDPYPTLLRELDDAELLAATDLLDARDEQVDTPPVEQVREPLPRLDEDRDA